LLKTSAQFYLNLGGGGEWDGKKEVCLNSVKIAFYFMGYKVQGWRQEVNKEFWSGNILEGRMCEIKLRWETGK
jgi:hypothetical protein